MVNILSLSVSVAYKCIGYEYMIEYEDNSQ